MLPHIFCFQLAMSSVVQNCKKTSSDIDVILPESRLLITDLITHEILFYLLFIT